MSDPKFVPVDLTELQDAGVLMMINEKMLWPLGLALTWTVEDGKASDLHIREWVFEDGHVERIELGEDDPVTQQRRSAFSTYLHERILKMPLAEQPTDMMKEYIYADEGFGGT